MHWMLKAAITVMISGMLALAGTAQLSGNYTIDPQGSGTRNYTTFAAATAALKAGVSGPVVFSVASTTFKEGVSITSAIHGASAVNTVTFTAPGNPTTLDGGGLEIGADWLRFSNLTIIGWRYTGIGFTNVNAATPRHNVISHVLVEKPSGSSVIQALYFAMGSEQNLIQHCTFRGGGRNQVVQIQGTGNVIDHCEFDGQGQCVMVVGNAGDKTIFQNCVIHSPGTAFCLREGHDNNLFVSNVFVSSIAQPTVAFLRDGSSPRQWSGCATFKNNIVINLGGGPAIAFDVHPLGTVLNPLVSDHNCFYAPNTSNVIQVYGILPTWPGQSYFAGSLAAFRAWQKNNPQFLVPGGPAGYDLNSIEGDPGLVSLTPPYDIHLKPTSPLIDKGTATIVEPYQTQIPPHRVPHDLDGEVRGWKPDIGADEIAASLTGSGGTSPGSIHALVARRRRATAGAATRSARRSAPAPSRSAGARSVSGWTTSWCSRWVRTGRRSSRATAARWMHTGNGTAEHPAAQDHSTRRPGDPLGLRHLRSAGEVRHLVRSRRPTA